MPLLSASLLLAVMPPAPVHWVASWSTAAAPERSANARPPPLWVQGETLREIVHVSLGGPRVRVRVSNLFGPAAAWIGAASVATQGGGVQLLTFAGRNGVLLPNDAEAVSDPVTLAVPDGADVVVNLYLPRRTEAAGIHYSAIQTSFIQPGDRTAAADWPNGGKAIHSWAFLAGVDVEAPAADFTLVAFGDSITDGAHSSENLNRRWPDILADRLRQAGGPGRVAVVDAGIGGNRLLHDFSGNPGFGVNALSRFDRDVLAQPGVRCVIILEGINDLGHAGGSAPASQAVTADDLTAALAQLVERAHENGLMAVLGTILPFQGTKSPGYYTPAKDEARRACNAWIRSQRLADGVVDFDAVTRDPAHPGQKLAAYDSGDHLHPGDAGYRAMGEAAASVVRTLVQH